MDKDAIEKIAYRRANVEILVYNRLKLAVAPIIIDNMCISASDFLNLAATAWEDILAEHKKFKQHHITCLESQGEAG